jgi:DNA-binding LacI/PurR family transcriptional regulator
MSSGVTMDEVAARAGVSRAAVSLALRGSPKISPERTEAILRAARELGYRPNAIASHLARARRSTIGILLADLFNPLMAEVLDGFAPSEDAWTDEMYLGAGFNSATRELRAVESFLAHRVSGIVLVGSRLPAEEIAGLAARVPTVVVGRKLDGVDCVLVDDTRGGRLATEHLIELGHERIAHVDGGSGAGAGRRRSAFLEVMAEAQLSPTVVPGDYSQASGYEAARGLFANVRERPTAIFAANDLMALGVLGAAKETGLVAGTDYALVGFDDNPFSETEYVSLTTLTYPRRRMGEEARRLLRARVTSGGNDGTEIVELEPTLVVRATSGAPRRRSVMLVGDVATRRPGR